VKRNRIVAGMADATLLVESAARGGGLITCGIAQDYGRSVFAFPGAVGAPYSEGCNNLIRDNGASLITSAEDFVNAMGWQTDAKRQQAQTEGIERTVFPDLSDDEQRIARVLDECGDFQLNQLSVKTNIPIGQLTALLFQLEMKGVVRPLAGGTYHLLK
jgi:DNA processing protein